MATNKQVLVNAKKECASIPGPTGANVNLEIIPIIKLIAATTMAAVTIAFIISHPLSQLLIL